MALLSPSARTSLANSSSHRTVLLRSSFRSVAFAISGVKSFDEIPGPRRWPLLGSVPDLISRIEPKNAGIVKLQQDYYHEFGNIIRTREGPKDGITLFHPHDHLSLFRSDGKYPDGAIRITWPVLKYAEKKKAELQAHEQGVYNMVAVGPEWADWRSKLNPDIFNPQAADTYYPLLNKASAAISSSLCEHTADLMKFSNLAVFDLFCSAILGKSLHVTDTSQANPRDVEYCMGAQQVFHLMGAMLWSPWEAMVQDIYETKNWKEFYSLMERQRELGADIIEEVRAEGVHPESYLAKILGSSNVTAEAAPIVVGDLLGAAVDTTGTTLFWFLYDLARHPDKQEKLAEELARHFGGGNYDPSKGAPEYLKACYRESQRFSPLGNGGTFKTTQKDVELAGYLVPKGVGVTTNTNAIQRDPRFVDRPEEFLPERWLPDAVAQRKGTPAEVIDHKILKSIFGFGPRMCLGARLAKNEIYSLVTRVVQDWIITVDKPHQYKEMKLLVTPHPMPSIKVQPRQTN